MDDRTCRRWFRKFRDGDCKDHARSGRLLVDSDDDLDTAITNSLHPTVEELAVTFSVHKAIVERRMYTLFFITKLDQLYHISLQQDNEKRGSAAVFICFPVTVGEPF